MASSDPASRIEELRKLIAHHDEKYFRQAAPEISDLDYDRLVAELESLEIEQSGTGGQTLLPGLAASPPGASATIRWTSSPITSTASGCSVWTRPTRRAT